MKNILLNIRLNQETPHMSATFGALFFATIATLSIIYIQYLLSKDASIIFTQSIKPAYFRFFWLIPHISFLLGLIFCALSIHKKETWKFWKVFTIILNLLLLVIILGSLLFATYIDMTHRQ